MKAPSEAWYLVPISRFSAPLTLSSSTAVTHGNSGVEGMAAELHMIWHRTPRFNAITFVLLLRRRISDTVIFVLVVESSTLTDES